MKKILLLGGSAQQIVAIETAKRLGYYTILCDYLTDNPGKYVADKFYLVSTVDKEAVLEVAKKEQVNGVLGYASDPAAPTAAYVAEKMGLPGNPYASVKMLCNKDKFREFLKENGFDTPQAYGYSSSEEALFDVHFFKYPIIVKPVDLSGSKGVTVLQSEEGLYDALNYAFSFSRCHRVIIEDFIANKYQYLIGGDIFVVNGQICIWGLMNCHRDDRVNPLVPIGKSYPLIINQDDMQHVKDTLRKLVHKLGIRSGGMNVELIVDKENRVFLIDVGPRSGGNMIPELIGDIFEVDIAEMSILVTMGVSVVCQPKESQSCYATYNLHSDKDGIYQDIQFMDKLEPYIYRKCLYKNKGDKVEYFDNASKCLGIVFMKFNEKMQMETILQSINQDINIILSEKKSVLPE